MICLLLHCTGTVRLGMIITDIKQALGDLPLSVHLLGGTVVVGSIVFLLKNVGKKMQARKEYPKDTVVFHDVLPGLNIPSMTPFGIKLGTYFRMARIPYEKVVTHKRSSKGKLTWIEYNGEAVADSEFCVEFLNKVRDVNLNSHLTPEQRGVGRAFQKMLEENTYWALALDRWIFDETKGIQKLFNLPWFIAWQVRRMIKQQAYSQGMGRHSKEEVYSILRSDFSALSQYLGDKKFLFGDKACQYDCAIFGILAPCLWEGFGGQATHIIREYQNICNYCENMKKEFWSDWNECLKKSGEK